MPTDHHLHLAIGLSDSPASERFGPGHWVELVREAERGLVDFVTIDDSPRGRLDAVMVANHVAARTRRVGIVPAAETTVTEPFLVSTQIATLDFVSHGRAGWQVEVSTDPGDGGYVGPRAVPPVAERFAEAADHVEVVRRLWDSWEDGAEIRDAATGRFIDRERLHHVDFEGPYFSVKGPSITPRPPQGQPVVVVPVGSPAERELARHAADVALVAPEDAGTWPTELRVFGDLVVFLDEDAARAAERRSRLDALEGAASAPDAEAFAGTPAQLVERLLAARELGLAGLRLRPAVVPHDLHAITRLVVPLLQAQGAFRTAYEADTLRGLLGLPRPANRHAAA